MSDEDNETQAGASSKKMAAEDYSSLTAVDRLTYCLWAADYNAQRW
ncbi:hypothetical protein A4U53_021170 [Rhizobium ruizarguesonis]|uniref:Uncharacterized protein n=1 Tax=Rhizobium ruizarguesonis TaxID=2081791 RepID=A0ACD5EU98_9HYPH